MHLHHLLNCETGLLCYHFNVWPIFSTIFHPKCNYPAPESFLALKHGRIEGTEHVLPHLMHAGFFKIYDQGKRSVRRHPLQQPFEPFLPEEVVHRMNNPVAVDVNFVAELDIDVFSEPCYPWFIIQCIKPVRPSSFRTGYPPPMMINKYDFPPTTSSQDVSKKLPLLLHFRVCFSLRVRYHRSWACHYGRKGSARKAPDSSLPQSLWAFPQPS